MTVCRPLPPNSFVATSPCWPRPGSLAAALAAKRATTTIPVVFETGADPVATGLVAGMRQPGGNVTGVTSLNAAVGGKRLELLHELFPNAPQLRAAGQSLQPQERRGDRRPTCRRRGKALSCELHVLQRQHARANSKSAFAGLGKLQVGGLVIANETFFANRSEQLAALARRYAVPAVHQSREFAVAGGLMSYGGSVAESHGQAGIYVGRILKGEKPARPARRAGHQGRDGRQHEGREARSASPCRSPMLGRADEVIE